MQTEICSVPGEARRYQGQGAGLVTRSIANTIDVVAVGAGLVVSYFCLNATLFMISPRDFEFTHGSLLLSLSAVLLALVGYLTIGWTITGRTYGDHVMGLRVMSRGARPLRFVTAFARAVFCVLFPIGLVWCAGSPSRRSLQDLLLRTTVIYDWTRRRSEAAGSTAAQW